MRLLSRRRLADPAEVAAVLTECLPQLEPGLRSLGRSTHAGAVAIDVAAADARGALVLIVCDVEAGPEHVMRALEGAAWWREHAPLAGRVLPEIRVDPERPPRALVVAQRFGDRALMLLRRLGALGPVAYELHLYADADGPVAALDPVEPGGLAPTPAPAPPPPAADATAERAAALIEALEKFRLREVFP